MVCVSVTVFDGDCDRVWEGVSDELLVWDAVRDGDLVPVKVLVAVLEVVADREAVRDGVLETVTAPAEVDGVCEAVLDVVLDCVAVLLGVPLGVNVNTPATAAGESAEPRHSLPEPNLVDT